MEADADELADSFGSGWDAELPAIFVDLGDEIVAHRGDDAPFDGLRDFARHSAAMLHRAHSGVNMPDMLGATLAYLEHVMTPERLHFLLVECNKRRNGRSVAAQQAAMARFFQVQPITVRRWQKGLTPIPRSVEVVMEIFYHWPEVTSDRVNELIKERGGIVDDVLK